MDSARTNSRNELHRALGRALVQVQGIELMLKQLLASRAFGGTVAQIEAQLASRHLDYATNTLGTLVKELFKDFLVPMGFDHPKVPDLAPDEKAALHFRMYIHLIPDELARVQQQFEQIVGTRNDVVHHLASRYALQTEAGCVEARRYIESFSEHLKSAWDDIKAWATSHDDAKLAHAQFLQSEEGYSMVVDGILPNGEVMWSVSGIVSALGEAAQAHSRPDGWAKLSDAIDWIDTHAPTQKPSRFGCSTYRQAIHESKAFEVKRERDEEGSVTFLFRRKA
jgi:hypothetical protein